MTDGDSAFEPVVIAIERDEGVIGREKRDYVAHRWNRDLSHVDGTEALVPPVPLGMVERMDAPQESFYGPNVVLWCEECFPDKQ